MKSKSKSISKSLQKGGFQPILHKSNKSITHSTNKRRKSRRASRSSSKSRSYNTPTPIYPLLK